MEQHAPGGRIPRQWGGESGGQDIRWQNGVVWLDPEQSHKNLFISS